MGIGDGDLKSQIQAHIAIWHNSQEPEDRTGIEQFTQGVPKLMNTDARSAELAPVPTSFKASARGRVGEEGEGEGLAVPLAESRHESKLH